MALEGHIEGNQCFSTAEFGEVQGAKGMGNCGTTATCDYVNATCTIHAKDSISVDSVKIINKGAMRAAPSKAKAMSKGTMRAAPSKARVEKILPVDQ
jgi:hypothetical protein